MLDTVGEPGHGLNPMSEPPVIVRTEGAVGLLTLNRPQALHALTTQMCGMMADALVAWRGDPQVQAVLIDHAGPRGFCAGGDVRAAAESGRNGGADARAFFRAEYQLNALLQAYEKPVVAIMDGVVMGGGAGLALPAQFRIATERTLFAMPEGAIGLFPDVGAGWWLPRLPGYSGLWLAMTGARLGPADCLLLGLATDFVDSAGVEPLKQALVDAPQRFEERLTELEGDAGEPPIALVREAIDHAFGQPTVEAIVACAGGGRVGLGQGPGGGVVGCVAHHAQAGAPAAPRGRAPAQLRRRDGRSSSASPGGSPSATISSRAFGRCWWTRIETRAGRPRR